MSGWIKLHRKIANWQWASSPNHMTMFMQLLLRANHKTTLWRKETIAPGQILTGRKQLMEWTGLTEMQVRKCLDDLESTSEISRKRSAKFSIITIANWNTYQSDNREITDEYPTNNQQTTTSNNVNNANNEKNIINTASPLSFLFDSRPDIQDWLDRGNHDTHKLILTKNKSHQELTELIEKAFDWAKPKSQRAETWLLTFVTNKKVSNSGQKQGKKPVSLVSPDNLTGNPYQAKLNALRAKGGNQ